MLEARGVPREVQGPFCCPFRMRFLEGLPLWGNLAVFRIGAVIASLIRNAPIAVNNSSAASPCRVTILAMADAAARGALTGRNREPGVLPPMRQRS